MKNTKEKIIQTAIALFRQEGYEKVSIDRICGKCGVTKGSFYHHFNSKGDVLAEYFQTLTDRDSEYFSDYMDDRSCLEQLWCLIEHPIDYAMIMGHNTLKYLWMHDIQHGGDILSPFHNTFGKSKRNIAMIQLIEQGQKNGEINSTKPAQELLFAYLSAFLGISVNWSADTSNYDVKSVLRRLFETIFLP